MTYGDLKVRCKQQFPGRSIDPSEARIGDRYAGILGELSWPRLDVQPMLDTVAPLSTGTALDTPGSVR